MTTNNKPAHTPGNWEFIELTYKSRGMGYIRAGSVDIIHSGVMELPDHENIANARLIAAAPDLLEALKNVIRTPSIANINAANDAIAKAAGLNDENEGG